jgi:MFS family permease
MDLSHDVSAIAHQIQLAIAPVFLLAGIGAILNVLTHRLARTVDRSRVLAAEFADLTEERRPLADAELDLLDRRILASNRAITCCTASALFVCLVVAVLFIAAPEEVVFARTIAGFFIGAMGLLIAGLSFFLHEIRLAMRALTLRRGKRRFS